MDKQDLTKVVEQAKKKDSEALSELYNRTHNMAYYTAISMLKNEQDALNVVQDSYISAFSKLDELEGNAMFAAWLKRIVVSGCKNMIKQKNPQLFCSVEAETNTLENIEEQKENFLPRAYIEQQAKREQIMQIINQLSDTQKTALLLFYYDQFSSDEVSQSLECSVREIQNRINYAKTYIMSRIEKEEAEENNLDETTPIPFLQRLFAEEAKTHPMPETVSQTTLNNILAAVTSTLGVKNKIKHMNPGLKCFIVIVFLAVVAGSIVGLRAIIHNYNLNAAHPSKTSSSQVSTTSIQSASSAAGGYLIKEYGGHIGLFKNNETVPIKEIKVNVFSLDSATQQLLTKGMYASDMNKVNNIISDFQDGDTDSSESSASSKNSASSQIPSKKATISPSGTPTTDKTHYFYNQLTAQEKSLYQILLNNVESMKNGTKQVNITSIASNSEWDSLMDKENWDTSKLGIAMYTAQTAFAGDYPNAFYLDTGKFYYNVHTDNHVTYSATISPDSSEKNYLQPGFNSLNDVNAASAKFDKTVQEIVVEAHQQKTTYDQIRFVHDYLTDTVTYDQSLKKNLVHTAYGALVNHLAVCDGYSAAFKCIMDKLGIPCIMVTGDSTVYNTKEHGAQWVKSHPDDLLHEWNYVQLDGKWYEMDVTWDDSDYKSTPLLSTPADNTQDRANYEASKVRPKYCYFLRCSGTFDHSEYQLTSYDDSSRFLNYPELSPIDYSPAKSTLTLSVSTKDELNKWTNQPVAFSLNASGFIPSNMNYAYRTITKDNTSKDDKKVSRWMDCGAAFTAYPPSGQSDSQIEYQFCIQDINDKVLTKNSETSYSVYQDTSAPHAVSTAPNSNSTIYPTKQIYKIEYNEPMKLVDEHTQPKITVNASPANLNWNCSDVCFSGERTLTFTFTPDSDHLGVKYSLNVAGLTDKAGNKPEPICYQTPTKASPCWKSFYAAGALVTQPALSKCGSTFINETGGAVVDLSNVALVQDKLAESEQASVKKQLQSKLNNNDGTIPCAIYKLSWKNQGSSITPKGTSSILLPFIHDNKNVDKNKYSVFQFTNGIDHVPTTINYKVTKEGLLIDANGESIYAVALGANNSNNAFLLPILIGILFIFLILAYCINRKHRKKLNTK